MRTGMAGRHILADLLIILCGTFLFVLTRNMLFLFLSWLVIATGLIVLESGRTVLRRVVGTALLGAYVAHLFMAGRLGWTYLNGRFFLVGLGAAVMVALAAYQRGRAVQEAQFFRDEYRETRSLLACTQDALLGQRRARAAAVDQRPSSGQSLLPALSLLQQALLDLSVLDGSRSALADDAVRGLARATTSLREAARLLQENVEGTEIA